MKLVFLGTSFAILYYMRYHRVVKLTYDKDQDTFKYEYVILPTAVLALLTSQAYTPLEVRSQLAEICQLAFRVSAMYRTCMTILSDSLQVLWTFSIYLEAVAILPQLVLLQRTQNIDNLTGNYVFLLG